MSQAVGLHLLDVIKFFFLLQVTSSSTHVEKHTWSIMGVMGLFWAIPKDFYQLIRHQRKKRERVRHEGEKKGNHERRRVLW